jgi:hypothetical protein
LAPFATLAAIIVGSVLAGRGFSGRGCSGRWPACSSGTRRRAPCRRLGLAFTAVVKLVNLDVAVVAAMPVALRAAGQHRMPAGRLAVAVEVTANAASFLLRTANITCLLLLGACHSGRWPE